MSDQQQPSLPAAVEQLVQRHAEWLVETFRFGSVSSVAVLLRSVAIAGAQAEREALGWRSIETPPAHEGPHSLPVLVWHSIGGEALGHYTPFYIGRVDDMVWTAETWSRRNGVVTHWMPRHDPPSGGTPEGT
jgi:hypothetical protein